MQRPLHSRSFARQATRAFTLVELLVVIAIIGVLIALLLPAVQAAREAARRNQCQANLKEQGLALNNYIDVHKQYPIGLQGGTVGATEDGFGWGFSLLPYLEQQTLYNWLSKPSNYLPAQFASAKKPFPSIFSISYGALGQKIIPRGETVLSVYRCPSSELASHSENGPALQNGYATSDYKACVGLGDRGMFFKVADGINNAQATRVRPQDVTDGLSNTIALGESSYYRINGSSNEDWPIWLGGAGSDEQTLFKTNSSSYIGCGIVPKSLEGFRNPPGPGPINDDCSFSWHEGGAFFVFADGSVHFISESIDIDNLERFGTKDDGEVITWPL
jgi:prepilin-type N-terminal cleavage/methylation domain-containing protein